MTLQYLGISECYAILKVTALLVLIHIFPSRINKNRPQPQIGPQYVKATKSFDFFFVKEELDAPMVELLSIVTSQIGLLKSFKMNLI